ncbi:hypothetical protein I302_108274 [Kwoniella bestiolae CBS 10118]|uniref:Uncharacterized protein n=1 Tax=Kwoniella bestiolae CBS 10118 TaxID=1296100 RepID=A0A1B9FW60_9TREE|nr:hypothetical protein I302_07359 [Kwoniella bestiolae CBS 10118]OCF23009.1 hypothetical protein I302_07359 [Kwoniella bestiolae CBS 10118]
MATRLLDLSDELLEEIAYWVDDATPLPLPSFTPHHVNLQSNIKAHTNKHLVNFRATCRQIRSICKIRPTNVVIKRSSQMQHWLKNAPEAVVIIVKRMVIDCKPEILGRNSSTFVSMDEHMFFTIAWPTFTEFLSVFTSLQELITMDTPLCLHDDTVVRVDVASLESPEYESFIPAAPFLEHLKIVSPTQSDDIPHMVTLWQTQQTKRLFPLKTLYYLLPIDSDVHDFENNLTHIQSACPLLEDICISMVAYKQLEHWVPPGEHIMARNVPERDHGWLYRRTCERQTSEWTIEDNLDVWRDDTSFMDFVDFWKIFEHLKRFDWSLLFGLYLSEQARISFSDY